MCMSVYMSVCTCRWVYRCSACGCDCGCAHVDMWCDYVCVDVDVGVCMCVGVHDASLNNTTNYSSHAKEQVHTIGCVSI